MPCNRAGPVGITFLEVKIQSQICLKVTGVEAVMTCVAVDWEERYWNQKRCEPSEEDLGLNTLPCFELASTADCTHQIALVLCSPTTCSLEEEWDSLKMNLDLSLSLSFGSCWSALGCYLFTMYRWMSQHAVINQTHLQLFSETQAQWCDTASITKLS